MYVYTILVESCIIPVVQPQAIGSGILIIQTILPGCLITEVVVINLARRCINVEEVVSSSLFDLARCKSLTPLNIFNQFRGQIIEVVLYTAWKL